MIVLGRRVGERLQITVPGHPPIWVMVAQVAGNHVRIGVDASRSVRVLREELLHLDEKKEHNDAPKAE